MDQWFMCDRLYREIGSNAARLYSVLYIANYNGLTFSQSTSLSCQIVVGLIIVNMK